MFSPDLTLLVHQERHNDLLREATHRRLVRAAQRQPPDSRRLGHRIVNWIGAQMVRWGYQLQHRTPEPR